jgi:Domain of Unknown Function (DUF1206)
LGTNRNIPFQLERLARVGYAARGFVYLIVGGLATAAAIGSGGRTTSAKGALIELYWQPLGYFLVAALSLGLCCFGAWRVYESIADPEGNGRGFRGIVMRLGFLVTGSMYLGLAGYAVKLVLLGSRGESTSDDPAARDWTAWLMAQPLGPWLVAAVGVGIIGAGVAAAYYAWTVDFKVEMTIDKRFRRWAGPVCRFGLVAHCILLLIVGAFLVLSAYRYDPSQARGIVGALSALRAQPYGQLLFGGVAFGLMAFGIYGFIEARFRRVGAYA